MRKCSNCGNELNEEVQFCPYCGSKQENRENYKDSVEVRFCTGCGRRWKEDDQFCPVCGKKRVEDPLAEAVAAEYTEKAPTKIRKPANSGTNPVSEILGDKVLNSNLLKILGIVFCIVYAYNSLSHLGYLATNIGSFKFLGVVLTVIYAWCAAMCFAVAFRCKQEYAPTLFLALAGGEILRGIFAIMEIYQLKEYQSWDTSIMIYWPLVDSIVVIVGGYYLMKREGMLEWQEGWQLMDYVKDIPVMLKQVFPKKGTSEAEAWKKEKKPLAQPKTEAEKVLLIVKDNLFLAFGVLYTVKVAYNILASFSIMKLTTGIFSILTCVAIWLIYSSGRKGTLTSSGFTISGVIAWIKVVGHGLIGLGLLMIVGNIDGMLCLVVLVVAALDVYYWWCIANILWTMRKNVMGGCQEINVGKYPIVILVLNVVKQVPGIIMMGAMQLGGNMLLHALYNLEYSSFGDTYSMLGGEMYNMVLGMLEKALGINSNVVMALILAAIPVLEILLLRKLRAYRSEEFAD